MELARVRVEWLGGMYEEFATLIDARQKVLDVYPSAQSMPWGTTADGNFRHLSFKEQPGSKGPPVARILVLLED
jgi:hypothetical protein